MIDKHPALIARCTGVADVVTAVDFAREHDIRVAVRGGGHNVAGNAVCDGGIVIDLSRLKGMRVDPSARTARAEPGLTWGEFDRKTQAFGLATTGGEVSTTGIAGLTLGGGFGWLMRKYGLACDNLLSVDVVTADGRILTASATENADFFWGLRGGGGNFGVVTSFEYRLHPVGPVLGGVLMYPLAKAREACRFFREYTRTAPDELTSTVALTVSPEREPVVAAIVCYCGALDAGEEIIRPLREVSPPLADFVGPTAYAELQTIFDEEFPFGIQTYWKANYLQGLSDEAIDTLLAHFATAPSPTCQLFVEHLGGAVSRVGEDATAFAHRDAHFDLVIVATWAEGAEAPPHIAWVRECWAAMEPFATGGVYVNYLGEDEADRVRAAYRAAKLERLATVKQTYDPMNLFRRNQNIPPAR